MTLKNKLVGVALLGVAVSSSALTLGRARGAVVLGQPLNLAIEVRLDSPDDANAQCFRVEVLHGDVPIDPSRIRVVVQPQGASSQDAVIRVRSSAVVDEPVIGVVLQALCGQQGSRRYDFLPEFPPELLAAQAPVAVVPDVSTLAPPSPAPESASSGSGAVPMAVPSRPPVPVTRPAVQAPPPAAVAAEPAAPRPAARAPAAAPRPAPRPVERPAPRPPAVAKAPAPKAAPAGAAQAPAPAAAQAPAPAPAIAATEATSAPSAGRPRLTLDAPTDASSTALRSSAALGAPPAAENLPQRAEAAAAWRALNAGPDDALRDAERLQALQAQEKAAVDARRKAEAELLARLERAERRLDEAENNRVDIAIVYGMLALLLAALAAAAFFWSRARKSAQEAAHWAQEAADAPRGFDSRISVRPSAHPSTTGAPDSLLQSAPGDVWMPTPKAAPAAPASAPAAPRSLPIPFPAATAPRAKGVGTDAALMRAANPEDFLDAQQHADFFVSLGQYDQAIEVLKKHIDDNAEMSPLAYLELMKIYHTLSRQGDYNALRQEFHGHFNARVPNFAAFTDEGIGLDEYPATMLSIETAWGSPRVLDTIEANIFRTEGDSGKPLDLAAYRDLLMLYAVAKTLARTDEASTGDTGGQLGGPGGSASDSAFMPQRLTRPDFTASLNSPDASFGRSASAPLAGAAAAAGAAGAWARREPEPELDSAPAPLRRHEPELMLDLDLSNSLSLALDDAPPLAPAPTAERTAAPIAMPAMAPIVAPVGPLAEVDIDLPLLEMEIEPETGYQTNPAVLNETAPQPPVPVATPKPEFDSSMIDFDLFDPNTEARIAPKSSR